MSHRKNPDFRRVGFTLIEMLVAIGILTVLATLSVAVIPRLLERAKASRGGDLLQGWLLEAKQMALRDRALRGIRLFVDADGYVRTALYIQQPDNLTGGFVTFDTTTPNPNRVFLNNLDVTGGQGANQALWPIQIGDYIQIQGGQAHQIAAINPTTTPNSVDTVIPVWSAQSGGPVGPTSNYAIIRQPRPMIGEPVLLLPDDVCIDGFQSVPTLAPGNTYDILFSPSGTLTGSFGDQNGKIIMWVRDITQDPDQPGEQPLIVVFCRTGRTGGFPVNPNPSLGSPYYYVLDPRATGF